MKIRIIGVLAVLVIGAVAGPGIASADAAFLCPIVGEGVINADANNGDHGVSTIGPPAGTSFLPGNNQGVGRVSLQ